jgi:hypothetical protein
MQQQLKGTIQAVIPLLLLMGIGVTMQQQQVVAVVAG